MELAESIKIDKNKKTLQVKLRQNCGWSDGTTITAQQMLKGIQLTFDEEAKNFNLFTSYFKNGIAILNDDKALSELGVRIIDKFTLEFDLVTSPDLLIEALTYPTFTPAPLHLMANDANAWPNKSLIRISSGPYQATSDDKDIIHFKRNPFICPSIKTSFEYIEYIKNNNNLDWAKNLVLNKIDVAHEVKPKQAQKITTNTPSNLDITMAQKSFERVAYIVLNPNSSILNDKRIRQAIMYSIDYDLINRIGSSIKVKKKSTITIPPITLAIILQATHYHLVTLKIEVRKQRTLCKN